MSEDRLVLKWGTIKAWDFNGNPEADKLVKQYLEGGASMSAIMQRDTPEQKKILCDLIRIHKGTIYLDWDGKYVTPNEAIAYIENYGKN